MSEKQKILVAGKAGYISNHYQDHAGGLSKKSVKIL
jgi:hypothetical protein